MKEFDPVELHMISRIMKAEKIMPDEFWCVEAVQELACILVKIEPLLPDSMMARLLGIGACLARQGKVEMTAGIHTAMAIQRARDQGAADEG